MLNAWDIEALILEKLANQPFIYTRCNLFRSFKNLCPFVLVQMRGRFDATTATRACRSKFPV